MSSSYLTRVFQPASLLEPTCGVGNFLVAAIEEFPELSIGIGVDINNNHVTRTKERLVACAYADKVRVVRKNFFEVDWKDLIDHLPEPILVVGNPPWVTNATLGARGKLKSAREIKLPEI